MKKSLVLAMAMALGVTASAYAANPFSDVPAGHWPMTESPNWQLLALSKGMAMTPSVATA